MTSVDMASGSINIIAIVQARMGSSRLANKMMLHLRGYPIIEWVFRRAGRARKVNSLVFAIPDTSLDKILASYLQGIRANVFMGSEDDVLDRFYRAAEQNRATHIVRICADNPVVCPDEIDNLINYYFQNSCDYAYNHIPRNNCYPDGLGAEIVSLAVLRQLHEKAGRASQREHIFNFIWDNQDLFDIQTFDPLNKRIRYPEVKLDIDTHEDYQKFLAAPIRVDMDTEEIVALFKELS